MTWLHHKPDSVANDLVSQGQQERTNQRKSHASFSQRSSAGHLEFSQKLIVAGSRLEQTTEHHVGSKSPETSQEQQFQTVLTRFVVPKI